MGGDLNHTLPDPSRAHPGAISHTFSDEAHHCDSAGKVFWSRFQTEGQSCLWASGTPDGMQGKHVLVSYKTHDEMFRGGTKGREREGSSWFGGEQT